MADWIDNIIKSGNGQCCGVCGKEITDGAYSVIEAGGSFAGDIDSSGEEISRIYLCSEYCRDNHMSAFWRKFFPGGQ